MEPPDALASFRRSLYECLRRRSDALFELTDAILAADTAVPVRVLSSGNARKNDKLDALATALATSSRNERLAAVDPEAASEVLRLLSERREDLVAERTRALNRLHGLLRDLLPGGVTGKLSAERAAHPARHKVQGRLGPPQTAVGFGDLARRPYSG